MALAAGARVQARALLRPWSRVPSAAPGRTPAAGGGGPGARCFGSPRVLVEPDPAAGVAVMKLRKPPVNSLSLELLTELVISLEKLENDKSFQGVIITSVGTLSSPGQGHRKAAVTSKSTPGTVGTSVVEKNQTGPDVDASVLCPQLLPRPDSREPPCSAVQARTQDSPGIFSAGLDLMEMCGRDPAHYAEYWKAVQELWLRLYLSHLVLICAVNGVSPAGGCLLALSCDYRILADNPKYTIGLNETQLGIVAPFWFADTLVNTIGHRAAERALQLGLLFPPAEALQVGIVDQVVPEDQVQSTARSVMAQWLAVPDHARQLTKNLMRKATADRLLKQRDADIQNFVSFISRDSIQKSLHMYIEKLQKKKG